MYWSRRLILYKEWIELMTAIKKIINELPIVHPRDYLNLSLSYTNGQSIVSTLQNQCIGDMSPIRLKINDV